MVQEREEHVGGCTSLQASYIAHLEARWRRRLVARSSFTVGREGVQVLTVYFRARVKPVSQQHTQPSSTIRLDLTTERCYIVSCARSRELFARIFFRETY